MVFFSFIGLQLSLGCAKRTENYELMVQASYQATESFFMLCQINPNADLLIVSQRQFKNMMIRHIKISTMLLKVLKMQWKSSGELIE